MCETNISFPHEVNHVRAQSIYILVELINFFHGVFFHLECSNSRHFLKIINNVLLEPSSIGENNNYLA